MKRKKTITVEIENRQLDALEDLLTAVSTKKEEDRCKKIVLQLWKKLVGEYDKINEQKTAQFRIIKTKKDYRVALERFEKIFSARKDSSENDEADILSLLIEDYENRHFIIKSRK